MSSLSKSGNSLTRNSLIETEQIAHLFLRNSTYVLNQTPSPNEESKI